MALAFGQAPFGLRELKIVSQDGTGAIALPVALMLHFTERVQKEEFTAEGVLVASRSFCVGLDWELEAGALDLAVYAKLTGRSAATAGITPNRTVTLDGNTGVDFPYVRIYGRAVGDAGTDDIHCKLFKAKLAAIEGTFRNGQFWVTSCAGVAVPDITFGVYEFVQHETAVVL